MERLRVQLLGGFLLEWEGTPIAPIPSRAGRSLFAYLVAHRDRAPTRDLLVGIFWPDLSEQRARRRLSQALWQIQSSLGELASPEPYLLTTASTVAFNTRAAYWLDVEEMEKGLLGTGESGFDRRYAELAAAIQLYRGDFLAGFYDDWVLIEQRRVRERYVAGLEELLQLAKRSGDFEAGLTYAHRLALNDPLSEEAHREVMRLAYLTGRVTEAIEQYEHCRSILEEELGVEPSESTHQLYREIVSRAERGARPFTPSPNSPLLEGAGAVPFIGREAERSAIVTRMEEAIGRRGRLVLLEGDTGVGKSRLLAQVADDAHWRGLGVLWGECRPNGGPFGAIIDALQTELSPLRARQLAQRMEPVWLGEVARLLPSLEDWLPELPSRVPLRSGEEPDRLREAFSRLLLALGSITPYLIVLDDLHDADPDTLRLLERLAVSLDGSALLVCLSYRGEDARDRVPVWEALLSIDRAVAPERITLTPLSETDTSELVRRGLGTAVLAEDAVRLLYKDTGGNPLFVLETLRAIHDYEATDAAVFLAGGDPLPRRDELPIAGSVQGLIAARLDALPMSAASIAEVAAVCGDRFSLEVLAATQRLRNVDLVDALEVLVRRGILLEIEERLEFGHGQVRRVAYERLSTPDALRIHLDVAQTLERLDSGGPAERAHHFTRAGVWEKAFSYHRLAAMAAAEVLAYETAAEHYTAASELASQAGVAPAVELELLRAFEDALDTLGRPEDRARVLRRMVGLDPSDPLLVLDIKLRQARAEGAAGRLEAAIRLSTEALEMARTEAGEGEIASCLTSLGTHLVWAGKAQEALAPLREAAGFLGEDIVRRAEVTHRLATALVDTQDYQAAGAALSAAMDDYETVGDLRGRAGVLGTAAIVAAETGDLGNARRLYEDAITLCRQIGYRRGEGVNLVNLASLRFLEGKPGTALDLYDQAAEIFRHVGEDRGEATVLANSASLRASLVGDVERAVADSSRALAYFEEVGDLRSQAQCLGVLAVADRAWGRPRSARRTLEHAIALADQSGHRWLALQQRRWLARVLLDLGQPGEALRAAEVAAAECDKLGMSDLRVNLLALQALALVELGSPDGAREIAEQALSGMEAGVESPHNVFLAWSRVLRATGDEAGSRGALDEARRRLVAALGDLPPALRDRAAKEVPEHREILAEWSAQHPSVLSMRLPTSGSGLPDIDVEVVTESPRDGWRSDREARERAIKLLVEESAHVGAAPTAADLSAALGVSLATIRRDLRRLRGRGESVPTRRSRA